MRRKGEIESRHQGHPRRRLEGASHTGDGLKSSKAAPVIVALSETAVPAFVGLPVNGPVALHRDRGGSADAQRSVSDGRGLARKDRRDSLPLGSCPCEGRASSIHGDPLAIEGGQGNRDGTGAVGRAEADVSRARKDGRGSQSVAENKRTARQTSLETSVRLGDSDRFFLVQAVEPVKTAIGGCGQEMQAISGLPSEIDPNAPKDGRVNGFLIQTISRSYGGGAV